MEASEALEYLKHESSKCMSCGFCESLCPTITLGPHRGYGPRGRVRLAWLVAEGSPLGPEGVASIYTCLLCAACTLRCPAGIDIPGVVRALRTLIAEGAIAAPGAAPIRMVARQ